MNETTIPHTYFEEDKIGKSPCRYGASCYRMNPEHVLAGHPRSHCPAYEGGVLRGVVLGFHMTSPQSASKILHSADGFRPGSTGMFGGGIYFATTYADVVGKAHEAGIVLACVVDIGEPYIALQSDPGLTLARVRALGKDSVVGPGGHAVSRTEFLVFEPERIKSFVVIISALGGGMEENVEHFTLATLEDKFPECGSLFAELMAAARQ